MFALIGSLFGGPICIVNFTVRFGERSLSIRKLFTFPDTSFALHDSTVTLNTRWRMALLHIDSRDWFITGVYSYLSHAFMYCHAGQSVINPLWHQATHCRVYNLPVNCISTWTETFQLVMESLKLPMVLSRQGLLNFSYITDCLHLGDITEAHDSSSPRVAVAHPPILDHSDLHAVYFHRS
jgi:hypothetical protein